MGATYANGSKPVIKRGVSPLPCCAAAAVLSTDGFPRRRGPVTGNNRPPPPSSPLLSPAPYGSDFKFEIALLLLDLRPTERGESFLPFLCRRAAVTAAVGRTFLTNQSEGGSDSRSERVRLRIKFHNGFLPLRNLFAPEKKGRKKEACTHATDGGRWLIASPRRRPPSASPVPVPSLSCFYLQRTEWW